MRNKENKERGLLKREKKISKKEILIVLIPTLVVAILVAVFLYKNDKDMTYKTKEDFVQYYLSGEYSVPKGTVYRRNDNKTLMERENGSQEVSSLVLYSKDSNKIFFPTDFIYYSCNGIKYYKVPAFSELSWDNKNKDNLEGKAGKCTVEKGFFYDGEDYYLFLEPTTLYYDGYETKLGAYSYIEVIAGYELVVYDYSTGQSVYAQIESEVTLTGESTGFVLNARNDSVQLHDGSNLLLFSRPDALEDIFTEGK